MVIRWSVALGALLLVLSGQPGLAQSSADALFHEAARQYVDGDNAAARRTVERGLEIAPSDKRLLALRKKLREQAERQQGNGQSGQSGGSDDQASDGSGGEQGQEDRSQGDPSEEQSRSEQGSQSESSPRQSPQDDPSAGQEERAGTPRPGRQRPQDGERAQILSEAQAARLLQALEAQEKQLLREVRVRELDKKPVEKDW